MSVNATIEENKELNKDEPRFRLEPPNGGFGYFVSIGAGLINSFNLALTSVFGLLFGPYLESLGQSTVGIVLVLNLCVTTVNFSGLFIGVILKKFPPRIVAITGIVLISSGLLICAFAQSYYQILLGYSLFVGLGQGLIIPSGFVAINPYFTTKKSRANGIVLAGTSIGQMVLPNLAGFLLIQVGFQKTVMTVACLSLMGIVGAFLFQPVQKHMKKVLIEEGKFLEKEIVVKNEKKDEKNSCWDRIVILMDLKLLKSLSFLNIVFGLGLCYMININFSTILPFYLQQNVKLTKQKTALCMSSLAGADFVSRLTFPLIAERFKLSCRTVILIGIGVMALTRTVLAEMSEFYVIIGICIMYGYFRAFMVVNQNVAVSEYCTKFCPESLPGALGLFMVTKGLCSICFGQFLGWIRDYSNSFPLCLHIQNVFILIVIVAWISEFLYEKYKK